METLTLSAAAMDLLKRNLAGSQILVTDGNREAYLHFHPSRIAHNSSLAA